jgi:SAM-dependent methyltransferase
LGNALWVFWLYLRDVLGFYHCGPLRKADLRLIKAYGLQSTFHLSAQATQALNPDQADLTVYGETPWCTLLRIAKAVDLQPGEHFVELGAGTGRNLLWAHYYAQAQATGYELVPAFVERFKAFTHASLSLHKQNWFEADLNALAGDVYLLVGTCYEEHHRQQANACLRQLPQGKRIVTISYALPANDFVLQCSFVAAFSWGKGTVFVHERA